MTTQNLIGGQMQAAAIALVHTPHPTTQQTQAIPTTIHQQQHPDVSCPVRREIVRIQQAQAQMQSCGL
jgi:hypothetical protein